MFEEKPQAPPPQGETCCRPTRRYVIAGLIAGFVLLVVYLLFGQQLLVSLRNLPRPEDALLGVVDVFKCCVLSWKAVTTMLPAFLLGGAIAAFAPTGLILRYLGARSNQPRAYLTAAASGILLSLCSCNVIPLFTSIYRRGAGTGPAFTFLFAGPAINVVAMIFTFQIIGFHLGIWRAIGVPVLAVIVGLLMTLIFGKHESARAEAALKAADAHETGLSWRLVALFAVLLATVVFGSWQTDIAVKRAEAGLPGAWNMLIIGMTALTLLLVALALKAFERHERRAWLHETWALVKLVIPVLLPAVIVIGLIATYIDVKLVYSLVGNVADGSGFWPTLRPILWADLFGEVMYFPILTEVAFTKAFLKLGMDVGPALALLLTGPGTSLPGFIIVARAIGWRKALVFELLLILTTTAYAFIFSSKIGEYICACMMGG